MELERRDAVVPLKSGHPGQAAWMGQGVTQAFKGPEGPGVAAVFQLRAEGPSPLRRGVPDWLCQIMQRRGKLPSNMQA